MNPQTMKDIIMIQTRTQRWLSGVAAVALLAVGITASGCKQRTEESTNAAASAQPSASGSVSAVPAGPCGKYVAAVCEAAGDKAPACTQITGASELLPPSACEAAMKDIAYTKTQIANARKQCDVLVAKLCKDLGNETESCQMVKKQTPNFPPDRCKMMMDRYDAVLGDLKRREDAKKPLSEDKQKRIAADDAPAFGPADAKAVLVEFSDFQCPYCSKAADATKQLKEKYGTKVRFVFRQFPLNFHKDAHLASQAALAANAQGKFWEYHDKLFANQKAIKRADLDKYAQELGLDVAKFKKALDEGTYKEAVDADLKIGQDASVQGTPTLFLNGARVQNATDFAAISKQIDELLKG